jgi:hypothetical protein
VLVTTAAGDVLAGRWQLVEPLGRTGDREVWRGHDQVLDREVAVEVRHGLDAETRALTLRRARQAVALSHPGIVSTYDVGEGDGGVWVVAEPATGEPLSEALQRDGRLSERAAFAIVGQVAMALRAAHDAGVVHGHLDPEAVRLLPDGGVEVAGFATPGTGTDTPATDVRALGDIARLASGPGTAEGGDLVARMLAAGGGSTPPDAAEIGRAALALAAAPATLPSTARAAATPAAPRGTEPVAAPSRQPAAPAYDDHERRRVRNRLLATGAVVVLLGLVALKLLAGGGTRQVTVPAVVGQPYPTAVAALHRADLAARERPVTDQARPTGTVVAQSPAVGARRRAGTVVTLDVAAGGSGAR